MFKGWGELLVVEGDDVLPGVAVGVNAFDGVTRTTSRGHVWDEALADPIPAGLASFPLERARWPGQLLAVVNSADRANHPITKTPAVRFERGAGRDDLARCFE